MLLFIVLVLGLTSTVNGANIPETAPTTANKAANKAGHGGGHGETPPEHFVVMDLVVELFHFEIGGLWVKITELKPKVLHIQELYLKGDKHKAYAKSLGVSTEVILLGFFIEHFGIAELFISAMSFSEYWLAQLAMSMVGVMLSTKAAVVVAETVEEAVEEKYHKSTHTTKPATSPH